MSVTQSNVIDALGSDESTGSIVMTISDHLDWSDAHSHLLYLQEKINSYIAFFESGEVYESMPKVDEATVTIKVVTKYSLSKEAKEFYSKVEEVLTEIGVELQVTKFESNV